ncbi:hypothetical protein D0962_30035 [Leptolyngbyaceae cyanobacterium CCMR0082]|uniref:Peptidase C-terminal archaeal/bacterial domain-containing protein n=2 Tax=Adonisia turfae TaxID=2950184 RepID=A0A6M0SF47_9CYAN|nr:hypothetical protein [Adonisia turfae]NEZ54489.1 hypothetical protein [Adonisia turfae CCMR0081]NEZ66946.1 hypothetical protein [Adonisia turfae CCMR0082]
MANYNVGALHDPIVSYTNYSLTQGDPTDVFRFSVFGGFMGNREIGIRLHDISANDNANLSLWRDTNNNGTIDASDDWVALALAPNNDDDTISFNASAGNYLLQVNRVNDSVGSVSYDLDLQATHSAGTLGGSVKSYSGGYLSNTNPKDVIEFTTNHPFQRNINVAVDNITNGGNVSLRMYRDNGNGVFDAADTLVAGELYSSGENSLNYRGTADTYFVELEYFNSDSTFFEYDLKLSRSNSKASNLLVGEFDVGDLTGFGYSNDGVVGNGFTTDTYEFSLGLYEGVDITLTNLTGEAYMRLIKDNNNNGIVDAGEVIAAVSSAGVLDKHINDITTSGDYALQVVMGPGGGNGGVNYTVDLNHFTTPYP